MRTLIIATAIAIAVTGAAGTIYATTGHLDKAVADSAAGMSRRAEAAAQGKARAACRAAVLKQIKSPGTARWADDRVKLDDNGFYNITGHVDAQNGFGATVRLSFDCAPNEFHNGVDALVTQLD